MSTRDKVVKLFGLRESILHDSVYLNTHSLAGVINVYTHTQYIVIETVIYLHSSIRVPEVTDNQRKKTLCLNSIIKTCSAWKTYSPAPRRYLDNQTSCMFVFYLNRNRYLPKSMSFYHDALLKISEPLLLQPESCQFGWPAPSWQVLILRFVMAFSLGSIIKT